VAATAKAPEPAAVAPRNSVAPPNEIEEIIVTPAQAQVGQSWVRQMPPGSFMVQHTILPSYGEATMWLQAHPNLRRARIVATYLNGQAAVQFTVVSGPFASLAEANSFAAGSGIPKDPQIRSARSMKDRFAPDTGMQDLPRRNP
jgi:septal ring-binding cell division protein DamX